MKLTDSQLLHNYNRGIKPTDPDDKERVKEMLRILKKHKQPGDPL